MAFNLLTKAAAVQNQQPGGMPRLFGLAGMATDDGDFAEGHRTVERADVQHFVKWVWNIHKANPMLPGRSRATASKDTMRCSPAHSGMGTSKRARQPCQFTDIAGQA